MEKEKNFKSLYNEFLYKLYEIKGYSDASIKGIEKYPFIDIRKDILITLENYIYQLKNILEKEVENGKNNDAE